MVHNQADDIEQLSRAVAQLARLVMPRQPRDFGKAAKAAGMTAGQVREFLDGMWAPPARQSVTLVNVLLEQSRAGSASYLAQIRTGHAGSDSAFGGHVSTKGEADAALGRLRADFGGWEIPEPDGYKLLGSEKPPRLVWRARRVDESWPDVAAATEAELAGKLAKVEAHQAKEAEQRARYMDGRGVPSRPGRSV
jgi:ABC-type transporter Mla subunit MlaD